LLASNLPKSLFKTYQTLNFTFWLNFASNKKTNMIQGMVFQWDILVGYWMGMHLVAGFD
jgi:hypothetical protein